MKVFISYDLKLNQNYIDIDISLRHYNYCLYILCCYYVLGACYIRRLCLLTMIALIFSMISWSVFDTRWASFTGAKHYTIDEAKHANCRLARSLFASIFLSCILHQDRLEGHQRWTTCLGWLFQGPCVPAVYPH